jgi:hypothetical protein
MGINDRFADLELTDVTAEAATLNVNCSAVAGTATASKAVILDANKAVDEVNTAKLSIGATGSEVEVTATPAELIRVADVSTRIVTLVATGNIVLATHEGKTLLMGEVGGNALATFTLPAATGSGAIYHFEVSVVNTSSYKIQVTTTDIMQGSIVTSNSEGTAISWTTAADSDTVELNATTKGGLQIGDRVEFRDILSGTWSVCGQVNSNGTEVTPFSAAVGA